MTQIRLKTHVEARKDEWWCVVRLWLGDAAPNRRADGEFLIGPWPSVDVAEEELKRGWRSLAIASTRELFEHGTGRATFSSFEGLGMPADPLRLPVPPVPQPKEPRRRPWWRSFFQ